ncbi:MAG: NUDIX hydrolase [Stackebrandtia sp.]
MIAEPDAVPAMAVTVDMAVFTVRDGRFEVLLIRRGKPPFASTLALPGGFLEPGEDLDQAAQRELIEETGLRPDRVHLEQFRGYGAPDRDPRAHIVTICYLALVPGPLLVHAGGDAASVRWVPVDEAVVGGYEMAFDHRNILADAAHNARLKLEHTTVATAFCPEQFTVADLRKVYEIVWGTTLDPRNFHRKVTKIPDFLVPTGDTTVRDGGRPAALYRAGTATVLQPPLYRPE